MADEYKVESGVEIPEKRKRSGKKYPFESMHVGDSFLIPVAEDSRPEFMRNRVLAMISIRAKALGEGYITRKVNGGLRGTAITKANLPERFKRKAYW